METSKERKRKYLKKYVKNLPFSQKKIFVLGENMDDIYKLLSKRELLKLMKTFIEAQKYIVSSNSTKDIKFKTRKQQ